MEVWSLTDTECTHKTGIRQTDRHYMFCEITCQAQDWHHWDIVPSWKFVRVHTKNRSKKDRQTLNALWKKAPTSCDTAKTFFHQGSLSLTHTECTHKTGVRQTDQTDKYYILGCWGGGQGGVRASSSSAQLASILEVLFAIWFWTCCMVSIELPSWALLTTWSAAMTGRRNSPCCSSLVPAFFEALVSSPSCCNACKWKETVSMPRFFARQKMPSFKHASLESGFLFTWDCNRKAVSQEGHCMPAHRENTTSQKPSRSWTLLRSIARPPYSKAPDVRVGSVRNRLSRSSGSKSFFLQAHVWERKFPDIHVPASRINLQQSSLDSCWMSVAASSSDGLVAVAARAVPSPPPLLPPFSIKLFSKPPRDAAAPLQELLSIPTITASVSRLLVSPNPMKSFAISPFSLMLLIFFIKASPSFSSQSHEEKKGETKPLWPQKNRIRFTTDAVKASWDKCNPLSLHRKFLQNQWTARDFRRLLCCSLAHLAVQSLAHAKTLGEYRKAKDTKTTQERPDWSIAHYCKL